MTGNGTTLYATITELAGRILPLDGRQPDPQALQAFADALRARPGGPDQLHATSAALRAALDKQSATERRGLLVLLDMVMTRMFEQSGHPEDLVAALDLSREAVASTDGMLRDGVSPAVLAWLRYSGTLLGDTRLSRAELGRLIPLLVHGVRACERLRVADGRDRLLAEVAFVLRAWNGRPGEVTSAEVDAVVGPLLELPMPPDGEPLTQALLSSLGALHMKRFHRSGLREHADLAVDTYTRLVAQARPLASLTLTLGDMLYSRYDRFRDRADLDRSVEVLRSGLGPDVNPGKEPGAREALQLSLAKALFERASLDLSEDDWRSADSAFRAAMSADTSVQGHVTGALGARARAEAAFAASVDRSAPDAEQRMRRVHRLINGAEADGSGEVAGAGADDVSDWLARRLVDRFNATGKAADHQHAVAAVRKAAESVTGEAAVHTRTTLADLLLAGYEATGSRSDIDECVGLLRELLSAEPADSDEGREERARLLSQLSGALAYRFEHAGDQADLDNSIAAMRESVALTPTSGSAATARAQRLGNLTSKLMVRAELLGSLTDVDEAVTAGTEAVRLFGVFVDHATLPLLLSNLGGAHRRRYQMRGDEADLDAALDALRRMLDLSAKGTPEHVRAMSNLGSSLLIADAAGREGLDEGITLIRAALDATSPSHPQHYFSRSVNLANALLLRWYRRHSRPDLDEAVALLRARLAAEEGDAARRRRADSMFLLAGALSSLYEETSDAGAAREAALLHADCARSPFAPAAQRIRAASLWAGLSERLGDVDGPDGALAAWSLAVGLLPVVSWRGLGRSDQESQLSEWTGTASAAAACALDAGRPQLAVELLEQGRSVLWTQLQQSRVEAGALSRLASGLTAELRQVGAALEEAAASAETSSDRLVALGRRWDALVERVGAELGDDSPFAPLRYETLARAAAGGPVVLVNVTARRSDAIVVFPPPVVPLVVPLPGLDLAETGRRAADFLRAVHDQGATEPQGHVALQMTMATTLEWLWEAVAKPVFDRLGLIDDGSGVPGKRIWWCPTGALTLLPLHAAGIVGGADGTWRRVIPSYTPTLRALVRTYQGGPDAEPAVLGRDGGRLLTVAVPDSPGQPPLPHVVSEAAGIAPRFPGLAHTALVDAQATRDRVRRELAGCSWAHFACHGRQDPTQASDSAVLLHDGALTVLDMARTRPAGAELAYVSACRTAASSVLLMDEAQHLAAGLQMAGFRHVVGTLWAVGDRSAAVTAGRFYDVLRDGGSPAAATAAAVERLRLDHPLEPSVWAGYVHFGP
ncbi:CHAT domain-containing protein [Streptomyces coeruleorubidus]|uniref:CHAT domain-containing protein n=1 Tax=Streptomyces coeruleorubidus TaxID=116188 RepID=UPI00237F0A3B|nr:CHAT domain-containing protein [Streptomyces coeruleorubidus]WDV52811.1 CHAT domain-containing protein [Streptomyces coeruleorubidus]